MAQASITATATGTLDGDTFNAGGTGVVDVTQITEQTRDVTDTYVSMISRPFSFIVVVNKGDDDVLVRFRADTATYLFFGIPPGGHLLMPGNGTDGNGLFNRLTDPSIRSVTSAGSRVFVMIGING